MMRLEKPATLRFIKISTMWDWWCKAMQGWLPDRWRTRWARVPDQVFLTNDGSNLRIQVQLSGQCSELESLSLPVTIGQMEQLLPVQAIALPRIWLVPVGQTLRRFMRLPAAVAPRLNEMLKFEIDRQTPFSSDQVHYAYRVLGKAEGDQIDIELIVLPREQLERSMEETGEVATALAGVDVTDGRSHLGVNLLPWEKRFVRPSRHAKQAAILVLFALVLTVLAAHRVMENQQLAVEMLQAQVRDLAPQAREVALQRQQLQVMVDGAAFFAQRKKHHPDRSAIWEALSERLPDGTWVERLSLEGEQLQVTGLSDQASALVSRLEGSPYWDRPSLTGVLQSEPGQRHDRFTLSATIRSGSGVVDVVVVENADASR